MQFIYLIDKRVIHMKKTSSLVSIGILLAASNVAFAHVDYGDLNLFPTQSNTFTRIGWYRGTDNPSSGCSIDGTSECLGDSHLMQFFKFTLSQDSEVTISFTSGQNGLDPAFSLYSGLLPDEAHDDTTLDPLNALDGNFDPIPHPTDSAYWNSSNTREGQFNALGNWSMANDANEWSEIEYITHMNSSNSATIGASEVLSYVLQAGSYTIAAAGANTSNVNALLAGTVSFSAVPVTAVPLPAAVWLMGSAVGAFGAMGRRRKIS